MNDLIVSEPKKKRLFIVDGKGTIPNGTEIVAEMDYFNTPLANNPTALNKGNLLSDANATALAFNGAPTTPNEAFGKLSSAKYYGKYSQMGGGSAVTGNYTADVSSLIAFSTEDKDELNCINLANSNTKIVIPSGISLVRFFISANVFLQITRAYGNETKFTLRKNGTDIFTFAFANWETAKTFCYINSYTLPIPCNPGDYFELFALMGLSNSGVTVPQVYAGTKFGMEALK